MPEERRLFERHAVTLKFTGKALPPAEQPGHAVDGDDFSGEIGNLSAGGLWLKTSRPTPTSGVIRCEIVVPDIPVGIPSLVRIRWARQPNGVSDYQLGLQFLL